MVKLVNCNDNSARNFHCVMLQDNLHIYFSYETPIAFWTPDGLVISENIWSNTTGKHLNWINKDKSIRVKNDEFKKRLTGKLQNLIGN